MNDAPSNEIGRPIALVDLAAQRARIADRLDAAIARVLRHGRYILGPEVQTFEDELTAFCGAGHAIACANGTDALTLALMAEGVGRGDAVFVPAFTFVATAEAPALIGATPVIVDVRPDTFNIDTESLKRAIDGLAGHDLRPRAVIAVDLFGQPAEYAALREIAEESGLVLIADAAQSFGATLDGRAVGTLAHYTTTSFFPSKPLGCYGDGGAVFTADGDAAGRLRSLRAHGSGADKYDNVRIGMNSRLDTIQAAVLIEKLAIFRDEIAARDRITARYGALLGDDVAAPRLLPGATSVWAQYTVRLPAGHRNAVAGRLKDQGIPTAVYYRKPLHRQPALAPLSVVGGDLAVSENLAEEVLSLPMHPYLDEATQERIVSALRSAVRDEAA